MKHDAEFLEFVTCSPSVPPKRIRSKLLAQVKRDLAPSKLQLGLKLAICHMLSAAVVVFNCPQLGVGTWSDHGTLMHFFHHFGSVACAALCGCIFLGTTSLFSLLFLHRGEFALATRYGLLNVGGIAALTLVLLSIAGAEATELEYLAWIAGAIAGGMFVWKVGETLRLRNFTSGSLKALSHH